MKNQTGRKIKVLRYDHDEEYNDTFLQFGQNNGIVIHFTNGKDGVAKEMNRALVEKVGICCLMHHWTNHFRLRRLCVLVIS